MPQASRTESNAVQPCRWRSTAGGLRVPIVCQEEGVGRKRTESDGQESGIESRKIDAQFDQAARDQLGKAVMVVAVLIRSGRGVRRRRRDSVNDARNQPPDMAEDPWCMEALDIVNEQPGSPELFDGFLMMVNRSVLVNVIQREPRVMSGFFLADLHTKMEMSFPVASMLYQLMQHGTDPDCAGESETQHHITGDKLLNCPDHRVCSVSVAVAARFSILRFDNPAGIPDVSWLGK